MADTKKLTKTDLTDAVYTEIKGFKKTEIAHICDLLFEKMASALSRGQSIEIRGFGTFGIKIRAARPGVRNPRTGEKLSVEEHGVIAFKPGKDIKTAARKLKSADITGTNAARTGEPLKNEGNS